jgi:VanZ family protein
MIAFFSTGTFSASNTGSVLEWFAHALRISLTSREFDLLHFLIRKAAHFSVYGLLSALFFRAWRGKPQGRPWKWSWAALALTVCLLAASSDEYHQSFTPGRTAAVHDVELDMMGALFAQFMIVAWTAKRKRI